MRQDAWNFSGMEQLVSVDDMSAAASGTTDTVESVPAVQSSATQCQKKSAQSFLGDNANLVNLDNLISFPSSSPSRELCAVHFIWVPALLVTKNSRTFQDPRSILPGPCHMPAMKPRPRKHFLAYLQPGKCTWWQQLWLFSYAETCI